MSEALQRLKWAAMGEWLTDGGGQLNNEDYQTIVQAAKQCLQLFETTQNPSNDDILEGVTNFVAAIDPLQHLMETFEQHGRKCSDTFVFWDNYITDLAQLLLDYIAAKRSDNKDMELETFAEMVPLDFVCGHHNYAKWGIVAIAEGQLLKQEHPEI
jgi:hypothetical protein